MHKFDSEERTTEFAERTVCLCGSLPKGSINNALTGQAAGSVGANYRKANDSLGKKDFFLRMRISRKEAKEVIYRLDLIEKANSEFKPRMQELKQEAKELKNILSATIDNTFKLRNAYLSLREAAAAKSCLRQIRRKRTISRLFRLHRDCRALSTGLAMTEKVCFVIQSNTGKNNKKL